MILVNDPGLPETFGPLRHSAWNGLSFADVIFPSFLFAVGAAIVFSIDGRRERGASRRDLALLIMRRAVILFALGWIYNGFPLVSLSRLRFTGTLQRIAICYGAAALLYLFASPRIRGMAVFALLVGYWALLRFVSPPGASAGWLTPSDNLASFIDRWVLGKHMYWAQFDPEGLLSTLPAIATSLLGTFAGALLRSGRSASEKFSRLSVGGVILLAGGLLWSPWFAINKPLWTSPFCLVTAAIAALTLASCYWLMEIRSWRAAAVPFQAMGASAIIAYFLSDGCFELQKRILVTTPGGGVEQLRIRLCQMLFSGWLEPRAASLAYALVQCVGWMALFSILRRRNIAVHV